MSVIDYLHVSMNNMIDVYKRNKYININTKNLFVVTVKLFELTISLKIDKAHRKKVVLKSLEQLSSNGYIESNINWEEYNTLKSMIHNIDLSKIEEEVFINENTCHCCF